MIIKMANIVTRLFCWKIRQLPN